MQSTKNYRDIWINEEQTTNSHRCFNVRLVIYTVPFTQMLKYQNINHLFEYMIPASMKVQHPNIQDILIHSRKIHHIIHLCSDRRNKNQYIQKF